MKVSERPVVGLLPAAGAGSRLGKLPFSKELLPLKLSTDTSRAGGTPVAIENAIASLVESDITRQHVIIAPGKRDIPAYLGDGTRIKARISYHVAESSPSVPHSLDTAFEFIEHCDVVLVFPDILFRPRNAISELIAFRADRNVDVTLALVPSNRGDKVDIVSCDENGNVREIAAKPGVKVDGWTWIVASWSPRFTRFLHQYLQQIEDRGRPQVARELYVADVLNAAIDGGLTIHGLKFPGGDAIDIGTPDDLTRAWLRDA